MLEDLSTMSDSAAVVLLLHFLDSAFGEEKWIKVGHQMNNWSLSCAATYLATQTEKHARLSHPCPVCMGLTQIVCQPHDRQHWGGVHAGWQGGRYGQHGQPHDQQLYIVNLNSVSTARSTTSSKLLPRLYFCTLPAVWPLVVKHTNASKRTVMLRCDPTGRETGTEVK